jgi:hypothetical protein
MRAAWFIICLVVTITCVTLGWVTNDGGPWAFAAAIWGFNTAMALIAMLEDTRW